MFTPWTITARPSASVIQRPEVASGGSGPGGGEGAAVEVVSVADMQVAVEALLLRQPLGSVRADRRPDIAEDRRRLAVRPGGAALDLLAGAGREGGRHPVEEDAVVARAAERAHLR